MIKSISYFQPYHELHALSILTVLISLNKICFHPPLLHTHTSAHLTSLIVLGSWCCLLFEAFISPTGEHWRLLLCCHSTTWRPPLQHIVTVSLGAHLLQTGLQPLQNKKHVKCIY